MSMQVDGAELDRLEALDARIVAASKEIKVLSRLSWPASVNREFLSGWERGQPRLPVVDYDRGGVDEAAAELEACTKELATREGPLARYLHSTASSYLTLCHLLEAAGTPALTEHSRRLYGEPTTPVTSGRLNNLEAAEHFLEVGTQYAEATTLSDDDYCLSAETVRDEMTARLDEVFEPGTVRVEIDSAMASKAAAGATRVRLRSGTCFSEYDLEQLLQHEAFVHSLTALNGRAQPRFKSLGLGAPRTTGPQEGLATFSELVTGAIDIGRMRRIAFRVVAIDRALRGADFIEVFRYLLDLHQTPEESFNSTMRVFRGVPTTGGHAFTKDVVYLHGLMEVHTFFRWAMRHQRLDLTRLFFAGRMTIGDAVRLAPLFEDGTLAGPRYLPPWSVRANGLAGYLAFSVFANRITIDELDEHHDFDEIADLDI